MITYQQALTENNFEHVSKTNKSDKQPMRVRRTGKTKTWKTRPDEFQIPVKYGLYESGYITHDNAKEWNVAPKFIP